MSEKPLVSIVIPFHNRIGWVIESIDSVFSQTYNNLEIILVDDGSDDKNKIPDKILSDSMVTILTQENKGPSAARNRGIREARGKYIAFLDSDDLFYPRKIEEQVAFMEAHADIAMSHTSYQYISETGEKLELVKSGLNSINSYPEIVLKCLIATPTVIIKREIFDSGYLFDESIKIGEDTILWSRIAKMYKIAGIENCLTYVRKHEQSTVLDNEAQFVGRNNILDYFLIKEDKNHYIKSKLLLGKAWNLYGNRLYKESFKLGLLSIANNPFNISGLLCMVASVTPRPVIIWVRNLKSILKK
jgi:glycosyltransferase involved in cell wall biosynthesis